MPRRRRSHSSMSEGIAAADGGVDELIADIVAIADLDDLKNGVGRVAHRVEGVVASEAAAEGQGVPSGLAVQARSGAKPGR